MLRESASDGKEYFVELESGKFGWGYESDGTDEAESWGSLVMFSGGRSIALDFIVQLGG